MKRSMIALLFLTAGCASVEAHNPFSSAETVEQTAFASIGVATIYLELTKDVIQNPGTPENLIPALVLAAEGVYTAITASNQALAAYTQVAKAPDTTAAKLNEALGGLMRALEKLRPAVANLLEAIKRAKDQ